VSEITHKSHRSTPHTDVVAGLASRRPQTFVAWNDHSLAALQQGSGPPPSYKPHFGETLASDHEPSGALLMGQR
jgi:hypothetical protein